ncbi:hypothetical protein KUCAC02_020598, partial [Chaenocephalus aceratus]
SAKKHLLSASVLFARLLALDSLPLKQEEAPCKPVAADMDGGRDDSETNRFQKTVVKGRGEGLTPQMAAGLSQMSSDYEVACFNPVIIMPFTPLGRHSARGHSTQGHLH